MKDTILLNKKLEEVIQLEDNIKEQIEGLEYDIFILQMKDHWDSSDYRRYDELNTKLKELKNGDNRK